MNLPVIMVKYIAIKRVLANLIQNALRYTDGDIKVSTGLADEGYVYMEVHDQGCGISETEIDRLFQPFTQGDTARGTEGSGLGLAIIKRITDSHGGKVKLQNQPEGGLVAQVLLPV
mgnify:CR=1 FL=1